MWKEKREKIELEEEPICVLTSLVFNPIDSNYPFCKLKEEPICVIPIFVICGNHLWFASWNDPVDYGEIY